jgi:hypothetical protein
MRFLLSFIIALSILVGTAANAACFKDLALTDAKMANSHAHCHSSHKSSTEKKACPVCDGQLCLMNAALEKNELWLEHKVAENFIPFSPFVDLSFAAIHPAMSVQQEIPAEIYFTHFLWAESLPVFLKKHSLIV